MPARVEANGQVFIDIIAGQKAYIDFIFNGPGQFSVLCTDLAGPIILGRWTNCPTDPTGPAQPTLPLTEGQYLLRTEHDRNPCGTAPSGFTPLDRVLRNRSFGPGMESFTICKSNSVATQCDIVVVIHDSTSGGSGDGDSVTDWTIITAADLAEHLKMDIPPEILKHVKYLRKRFRPVPPEPPIKRIES